MALRFRRSIKLLPGLRANIGLRGVSLSVGTRGASINVGKRGVRGTAGIPGTGITHTTSLSGSRSGNVSSGAPLARTGGSEAPGLDDRSPDTSYAVSVELGRLVGRFFGSVWGWGLLLALLVWRYWIN